MAPKEDKPKGKKPAPKKVAEKKAAPAADGEKAPVKAVQRAHKVQKKVVKGLHGTRVKKVRTSHLQTCQGTQVPTQVYPQEEQDGRLQHH